MKQEIIITSSNDIDAVITLLIKAVGESPHKININKCVVGRTLPQNASLHLYCTTIASKLNAAGETQRSVFEKQKEGFEIQVSMECIKGIFRKVGLDMFGKKSTSSLETTEIQDVYKSVDRGFDLLYGVRSEWPSREGNYCK